MGILTDLSRPDLTVHGRAGLAFDLMLLVANFTIAVTAAHVAVFRDNANVLLSATVAVVCLGFAAGMARAILGNHYRHLPGPRPAAGNAR